MSAGVGKFARHADYYATGASFMARVGPPRPRRPREQSVSAALAIIWKGGPSLSRISRADGVAAYNPITAARRDRWT